MDDVERFWAEEAEEPPRPAPRTGHRASRHRTRLPAPVVACAWGPIALTLFGAPPAGLAIGVVTALGWALWRVWPRLGDLGAGTTWSVLGEVHRGLSTHRRPAGDRREHGPDGR
ncbi:hypothetical protein [Geodermatophilus sp. SYSU D00815]